jgi:hypothetical protein
LEINILAQYYWLNQIMPLKQVDEKTRTATLVAPLPAYTICPNNPFRVENVPEGLTRPGTWCLNTKTGAVTLWPEDGVDLTESVVTAPVLPVLVRCEGQEQGDHLVRGLTTIHNVMQRLEDGGAVYLGFEGGQNIVRGNLINGVRGGRMAVGIYMDAESDREVIEGNVAWDCDLPEFDNGEAGNNNNRWGKNLLSRGKEEPPQAKTLRDTIAAKRKKGLHSIDEGP